MNSEHIHARRASEQFEQAHRTQRQGREGASNDASRL